VHTTLIKVISNENKYLSIKIMGGLKMKKIVNLLLIVLLSFSVMAQEETLSSGKVEHGGYGAIFTQVGQINGKTGVFMGGQGAWLINHRIGIGGKGYALINPLEVNGEDNVKLEFGCWGGLIEYVIASDKLLHGNIHCMIGGGGVRYAIIDYNDPHPDIDYSEDGVFVMEPGADLILNIAKNFRLGIGVSYRIVSGVSYADLSNSDLNGFSGRIILKFGAF